MTSTRTRPRDHDSQQQTAGASMPRTRQPDTEHHQPTRNARAPVQPQNVRPKCEMVLTET